MAPKSMFQDKIKAKTLSNNLKTPCKRESSSILPDATPSTCQKSKINPPKTSTGNTKIIPYKI